MDGWEGRQLSRGSNDRVALLAGGSFFLRLSALLYATPSCRVDLRENLQHRRPRRRTQPKRTDGLSLFLARSQDSAIGRRGAGPVRRLQQPLCSAGWCCFFREKYCWLAGPGWLWLVLVLCKREILLAGCSEDEANRVLWTSPDFIFAHKFNLTKIYL